MLPDSSGCHIIRKEMPSLHVSSGIFSIFWKFMPNISIRRPDPAF